MPKTTYNMITREWVLRHQEAYEVIWRTPAFQEFCRRDKDRVKKEVQDERYALSQKPEEDREAEAEWLKVPFDEAVEEVLRCDFLKTNKGQIIQDHLASKGLDFHQMAIACEQRLVADKYLFFRIDLTFPKERLRAEFEHILDEWHPRVKRPPAPPRGTAALNLDKIARMYRAYDLVEKHQGSYLKATWEFFPDTEGKSPNDDFDTDKNLKQIKRWHKKIKTIISALNRQNDR